MRYCRVFFLTVLAVPFLVQQNAHAYLDPASGSILIQMILGGIAGFFVMLKVYGRRIKRFFTPGSKAASSND